VESGDEVAEWSGSALASIDQAEEWSDQEMGRTWEKGAGGGAAAGR
jgi:hypothetical protein